MSLKNEFDRVLAESADVATSNYLQRAGEDVLLVEAQAAGCPELNKRVERLCNQLAQKNFALDAEAINKFLQDLAEAQFFALCRMRGVSLEPVPTQSQKQQRTPDYSLTGDEQTTFEVKALSVVGGNFGIDRDLVSSFDAKVRFDERLKSRPGIAFVENETTAYGDKVRATHVNVDHLYVLLEKVRQNIKQDQYPTLRSFLVLNTSVLPVLGSGFVDLRPVYWDENPSPHPVSGAMWMLAFGRAGMAVFGHPEFEGMPVIEGYFSKQGLLHEYDNISGIIVIRRELNGELRVGALLRSRDWQAWSNEQTIWPWIHALVQDKWNDEMDSNGWCL